MNYDALEQRYWGDQQRRVSSLVQKIQARPSLSNGRVVPEDADLSIGDGRRLSMAVMFIDICGFSSRPMETLTDQENTLRCLNLYFTEMIRIAEDYGGNVEKNTGDGLLIYFNDGEGNPAEAGSKRAVSCALTMLATTKHVINPVLEISGIKSIEFRTSIDYGNVTVAKIGAPRRFNANVAIGATANFASKALRFAGAGEIVIGEAARNQLPQYWQANWTELIALPSGWIHVNDQSPYWLYRYIGRWVNLL